MTKEERIAVFENTIKIAQKGRYISPNEGEIIIQDTDRMIKNTKFYTRKAIVDFENIDRFNTNIKVINKDCLLAARDLFMDGYDAAVLNMASYIKPGGGVLRGSAAQEENIFRRTNLFQSLYMFDYVGKNYGIEQREERYPLDYNFGAIYTPYVTVFRDGENENYEYRNDPFSVSIITAAALKKPQLTPNGELKPWDIDVLTNKVKQIFSVALENKHTNIVLSAFGCGAYGTPPTEMAKIFDKVLKNDDYRGAFENVIFAIIDDNNAFGKHNPQGNFKPFADVFNG